MQLRILIGLITFFIASFSAQAITYTVTPLKSMEAGQCYAEDSWDIDYQGETASYLNFCTNNDIKIGNTTVGGKIWSSNFGWIDLNNVSNAITGEGETLRGELSGFAWSEDMTSD